MTSTDQLAGTRAFPADRYMQVDRHAAPSRLASAKREEHGADRLVCQLEGVSLQPAKQALLDEMHSSVRCTEAVGSYRKSAGQDHALKGLQTSTSHEVQSFFMQQGSMSCKYSMSKGAGIGGPMRDYQQGSGRG